MTVLPKARSILEVPLPDKNKKMDLPSKEEFEGWEQAQVALFLCKVSAGRKTKVFLDKFSNILICAICCLIITLNIQLRQGIK